MSRRFEPQEGKGEAQLRIKNRDHKVQLNDISLGGFGVMAEPNCPAKNDDKLLLKTDFGWHKVVVRHVKKVDGSLQIGLELIEDVPVMREKRSPFEWIARVNPARYVNGRQVLMCVGAFLFVFAMGMVCSVFFLNSPLASIIREAIADHY